MVEPARNRITNRSPRLEPTHCRSISHEIGARLRLTLDRDRSPLPPCLRGMLDRFEEADAWARLQSCSKNRSTADNGAP